MKLQIQIPDELFETLETRAKDQKTTVPALIQNNITYLTSIDSKKHQVILQSEDLEVLSKLEGGKLLKTATDVVDLFKKNANLSVGGCTVTLSPEDMNFLKTTYESFPHMTFPEFIEANVKEGLAMYLYGSSMGLLY